MGDCSSTDPAELSACVVELQSQLVSLQESYAAFESESQGVTRHFFLFYGGMIVFFMQAGFALLEAGSVRMKNTKNILLKNFLDAAIGCILWWFIGWPIAYGSDDDNMVVGVGDYLLSGDNFEREVWGTDNMFPDWFFQWAFAATAATIVSGAVAERCAFKAYILYTCFITGIVYPPIAKWCWGGGFLVDWGYKDFAGSGVVHLTGGVSALMGAIFLGPRHGRFTEEGGVVDYKGHSAPLAALGTFILWFAWYAFNSVSTLEMYNGGMYTASRVAVVTTLCGAGGCISTVIVEKYTNKSLDLAPVLNGCLAGLVASSCPAPFVHPWAGLIIGFIAGLVMCGLSRLLVRLRVDDPLDAFAVHGGGGMTGVILLGLFDVDSGLFYLGNDGPAEDSELLGWQIVGVIFIWLWAGVSSAVVFFLLKKFVGLRVSLETELEGMDLKKHGGLAYESIELESKPSNGAVAA
eukprot:Rmarinus@m.26821